MCSAYPDWSRHVDCTHSLTSVLLLQNAVFSSWCCWPCRATGSEEGRTSDMIGCPFCFPPFVAMADTFLLPMQHQQLPLASSPPRDTIISSPALSLFELSHRLPSCLCLCSTCSHLRLYLDSALKLHASFCFLFSLLF